VSCGWLCHQSSYEETWEDMFSVLDLQSVLEGDTVSEVDREWERFSSERSVSPSLALMHNVSMTASSADMLSTTGERTSTLVNQQTLCSLFSSL